MTVQTQRHGAVLSLGIDRPARRNALDGATYTALAEGLAAASADRAIRAVVLHGHEAVFTSGNDLADFQKIAAAAPGLPDLGAWPVTRFLQALLNFDKPLLAAVCGPAVGVGTTLLLHCDLIWAGENATFSLPFVNLGLCPEAGSALLLPAAVGSARAAAWLLYGEPVDAQQALAAGFINGVLPAAQVLPHVLERAQALATRPLASLQQTRRLMRAPRRAALEATMADETATFARMLGEPAAQEAFRAFFERRAPDFSAL